MKIVAVFGDAANQRTLANRLHASAPLAHVARIRLASRRRHSWMRALASVTIARALRTAWLKLNRHYDRLFPAWPSIPTSIHTSANADSLAALIELERPDLILVSGTDLLSARTIERFKTRIMNLHTGISPYIRGGPNCTNWALALGEFDLIGNTVMWIDPGIDSGALIATERTPLNGRETLIDLHLKVMDHAHDLFCRAVVSYRSGTMFEAVPQSEIAKGRLILSRDWTAGAMVRAVLNHKLRYRPFTVRQDLRLVPLDNGASN